MSYLISPVAYVREGRPSAEDDFWGGAVCRLELAEGFGADSIAGLEDFSHLEVVYVFDRVDPGTVETSARHPRNRADWPLVGIFGQRGKRRPNRLGVSRCRLINIEGTSLLVEGLDAMDGTPIVDIKPWMAEFGPRGDVRQAAWSAQLMRDYYRPAAEAGSATAGSVAPTRPDSEDAQGCSVGQGTADSQVRRAEAADVPALVALRRQMFSSMGVEDADDPQWQSEAARWFAARAQSPDYGIFVVTVGERVVACAMGAIRDAAPSPGVTHGKDVLVSNVVTDPEHRGRGYGRLAFEAVMRWAEGTDVTRYELFATPAGQGMYERAGFRETSFPGMRLTRS